MRNDISYPLARYEMPPVREGRNSGSEGAESKRGTATMEWKEERNPRGSHLLG